MNLKEDFFIQLIPIKRYYINNNSDRVYITEREKSCLNWCMQGKSCDETAMILGISKRTVENKFKELRKNWVVTNNQD